MHQIIARYDKKDYVLAFFDILIIVINILFNIKLIDRLYTLFIFVTVTKFLISKLYHDVI